MDRDTAYRPFDFRVQALREIEYYRDDSLVLRLMGLKRLPDVSTISRNLSQLDTQRIGHIQKLSQSFVIDGLQGSVKHSGEIRHENLKNPLVLQEKHHFQCSKICNQVALLFLDGRKLWIAYFISTLCDGS